MAPNDWIAIKLETKAWEEAEARKRGVVRGALLAAPLAFALGVGVMFAAHLGRAAYKDYQHDEVVRGINKDLDDCSAVVLHYQDVAKLERDAVASMGTRQ